MKVFFAALSICFTLALLVFACPAFAQPRLLKDINVEATANTNSSFWTPGTIKYKDRLYFAAQSDQYGVELFSTDGTPGGTKLLKDISPGSKGFTSRVEMGVINNMLVFGFSGDDGSFLWKTDGTSEGTVQIAIVVAASFEGYYAVLNNFIYFTGWDEVHGYELWRSDGTTQGTSIVKDIHPGMEGSTAEKTALYNGNYAHQVVAGDNEIFLIANDGVHGDEIWRSNGTPTGTSLLKDIQPNVDDVFFTALTAHANKLYFIADDGTGIRFWRSDGTLDGTFTMDGTPEIGTRFSERMFAIGDNLIFRDNAVGGGIHWFILDPATDEITRLVAIDAALSPVYATNSEPAVKLNGLAYFLTSSSPGHSPIWKSDGTPEGTSLFTTLDEVIFNIREIVAVDGKLYVVVAGNDEYILKVSDGVSPFTTIFKAKNIFDLSDFGGKLFLWVNDKTHGYEPWVSDGTTAGTIRLKDIDMFTSLGTWKLRSAGNRLLFVDPGISRSTSFDDLWASDGTDPGTVYLRSFAGVGNYVAINNEKIVLETFDPSGSTSVWISDGTDAGTSQLLDGLGHQQSAYGRRFRWVNNTLFIFDGYGRLYKSGGTAAGTVLVANASGNNFGPSQPFKNLFYFFFDNELWKTDGAAVSSKLTDVVEYTDRTDPVTSFMAGENKMYFVAMGNDARWKVWASDGTAAGTQIVKNANEINSDASNFPDLLAVINDVAVFTTSREDDAELWRSDGTEAGTILLKDIKPGPLSSYPRVLAVSEGTMYFTANDGIHGHELWKTDGTASGTVMIKDIFPGEYASVPWTSSAAHVVGGVMYFAADDGVHGIELWQTDGTSAGTSLVFDMNPGKADGMFAGFESMTSVGNTLYFMANEPQHGREIWMYGDVVTAVPGDEVIVSVSPNPATNSLLIRVPEDRSFQHVSLKDMLGRDVITANIAGNETTIDVGSLPRGMYVVRLKDNDNRYLSTKIILK